MSELSEDLSERDLFYYSKWVAARSGDSAFIKANNSGFIFKAKQLEAQNKALSDEVEILVAYSKSLERFMIEVSLKVGCLPDFTEPTPDKGNKHIFEALDDLLNNQVTSKE